MITPHARGRAVAGRAGLALEALFPRSLDARRRLGDANPLTLASQDGLTRVAAARARPAAKR